MVHVASSLTIAGTDPSGGAGIYADLKTFQELKSYGMSIITSVVAQNTTGVQAIHHLPIEMIEQQLLSVISDMPINALKSGMLANIEIMEIIAKHISEIEAAYVLDPVMVATSGDVLIEESARTFLRDQLLPMAALVTPNIPEAEYLLEVKIETEEDMKNAAIEIVKQFGVGAALVKGGHRTGAAIDFLYDGKEIHTFSEERIDTKNTHGTGCTYAAAITGYLSHGKSLLEAVHLGKEFVTAAIKHSFPLGAGSGPTNHWALRMENE